MPARRRDELRPRKQPRQSRSRETVTAILEAAARVFAQHGYAAGTTNRIAAKAGVSVGSLYEYFPNKDALLVALLEAHIAEGNAALSAVATEVLLPGRSLRDVAERLVRAMIDLHSRDRKLHRVLFEETPLPPQVRRQLDAVERSVAAHLATYLRHHPEVTAPDADLAAMVVVQAIEALTHRLLLHGAPEELEAQTEEFVRLTTGYLSAPR